MLGVVVDDRVELHRRATHLHFALRVAHHRRDIHLRVRRQPLDLGALVVGQDVRTGEAIGRSDQRVLGRSDHVEREAVALAARDGLGVGRAEQTQPAADLLDVARPALRRSQRGDE